MYMLLRSVQVPRAEASQQKGNSHERSASCLPGKGPPSVETGQSPGKPGSDSVGRASSGERLPPVRLWCDSHQKDWEDLSVLALLAVRATLPPADQELYVPPAKDVPHRSP